MVSERPQLWSHPAQSSPNSVKHTHSKAKGHRPRFHVSELEWGSPKREHPEMAVTLEKNQWWNMVSIILTVRGWLDKKLHTMTLTLRSRSQKGHQKFPQPWSMIVLSTIFLLQIGFFQELKIFSAIMIHYGAILEATWSVFGPSKILIKAMLSSWKTSWPVGQKGLRWRIRQHIQL